MSYGIIDLAKDALTGNITYVDEQAQKARMSICLTCDKFNSLLKTCGECGCYMPAKVKYAQSTCPLRKW